VVLTVHNDLDDQLFGQLQLCADIIGQSPVQASGHKHLRELLKWASGGVVYTTIHKFMPLSKISRALSSPWAILATQTMTTPVINPAKN